jgi:hypothetical protein
MMTVAGTSVAFSLTASSQSSAITRPTSERPGIYISNSGADRVTVQLGTGSATAVLNAGVTVPPNNAVIIDFPPKIDTIAVIGTTTGNTVVATPVLY